MPLRAGAGSLSIVDSPSEKFSAASRVHFFRAYASEKEKCAYLAVGVANIAQVKPEDLVPATEREEFHWIGQW